MQPTAIHVVSASRASDSERRSGLLAYLVLAIGPVEIDGVALRRSASDRLGLTFPVRTKGGGRRYPVVRFADASVRAAIEQAVLRQLAEHEGLAEDVLR